jgi:hypothetical protein
MIERYSKMLSKTSPVKSMRLSKSDFDIGELSYVKFKIEHFFTFSYKTCRNVCIFGELLYINLEIEFHAGIFT